MRMPFRYSGSSRIYDRAVKTTAFPGLSKRGRPVHVTIATDFRDWAKGRRDGEANEDYGFIDVNCLIDTIYGRCHKSSKNLIYTEFVNHVGGMSVPDELISQLTFSFHRIRQIVRRSTPRVLGWLPGRLVTRVQFARRKRRRDVSRSPQPTA